MASWVTTLEQRSISPNARSFAGADGNVVAAGSEGTGSPKAGANPTPGGEGRVSGGKSGSGTAQSTVWTV
jgi:hypothetical protein